MPPRRRHLDESDDSPIEPGEPHIVEDERSATAERGTGVVTFSSGMVLRLASGELEDGWRRFGCPNCGQKHDVGYPAGQSPGTWNVPFSCQAGCGCVQDPIPVS